MADRLLPDCSVESLKHDFEMLPAARGLYAKEAKAMARTWEESWFEEGLRVFYVLPRQRMDAILPLGITPELKALWHVLGAHDWARSPDTPGPMGSRTRKLAQEHRSANAAGEPSASKPLSRWTTTPGVSRFVPLFQGNRSFEKASPLFFRQGSSLVS